MPVRLVNTTTSYERRAERGAVANLRARAERAQRLLLLEQLRAAVGCDSTRAQYGRDGLADSNGRDAARTTSTCARLVILAGDADVRIERVTGRSPLAIGSARLRFLA